MAKNSRSAPSQLIAILNNSSQAKAVAEQYMLRLVDDDAGLTVCLQYINGRLSVYLPDQKQLKPFAIDFSNLQIRIQNNLNRHDPLLRALGKGRPSVVDATAGLATDAYVMAAWGCNVVAIEQSNVVQALLADACRRDQNFPENLKILAGDSLVKMPSADVVYLDFMFPERKYKSEVGKEMQILQAVLADYQQNELAVFNRACECAQQRVVVKRPLKALPIADSAAFAIKGKTVRFDVYLQN